MHFPTKLLAGALALGLSACALDSAAHLPSLDDPSNPAAPESRPYPAFALRASNSPPAEHPLPHAEHEEPEASEPILAAVVYSCPMHPRVTASEPGRCPQCGMKLVPRESPPSSGDAR